MILSQIRIISNVKAVRSAVTAVLKKLSQLSRKAVTVVIRQLLFYVEADEVNWVISNCWKGHSAFILWIWVKIVRSLSRVS